MLEVVRISHLPPEIAIYAALYFDVQNVAFLRSQLLAGNSAFEYAFVDASMILSRKHVLSATFRAVNDHLNNRLKSRNIHSEIVFALSPNNNIGEAFRRFGLNDSTKNVLVIKVVLDPTLTLENIESHLAGAVNGTSVELNDANLHDMSDLQRIKKVYKLIDQIPRNRPHSQQLSNGAAPGISLEQRGALETQVLGIMAIRGAA